MTARQIIIALNNKFNGDWDKIYDFIYNKKELGENLDLTGENELITILDSEYPSNLKNMYRPPFVITKEQAQLKKYRVSITYELEAYTDEQAQNMVQQFDIDLDNIVKVSKVKRA